MSHTIRGLIPILATPFHPDGSLDLPSLRRLTTFQIESGVDGIAVSGMASEAFALTAAERQQILLEVLEVVSGAVPVVAGVNGTSTATAIEQAQQAEANGADMLMVLPPFMVKPSQTQIIDFYHDVAASTDTHVMVQDAPGATDVHLSQTAIVEISKIASVTSVKVEAPPTAAKVAAVVNAVDEDFVVFGGQNAQFCLEEYARGAIGTMPACEFPDLLAPVLADWNADRQKAARRSFSNLLPLIIFGLQPKIAWAVHKEVLVARGLIQHPTVRPPAQPLSAFDRESIAAILEAIDVPSQRNVD